MSNHQHNQDLRSTANGGWSWAEYELGSVFAPIVGPAACWVYQAMCALVPLAAKYSDKLITTRRLSEFSCVPRSTVNRELNKLIDVGMVIKTNHMFGPASYKLPSLRELAKVGEAELLKRANVPAGDAAPYDQRVANKREREVRLEKQKNVREKDGRERVLPLYAQEKPASDHDQVSVPPRDTASAGASSDQAAGAVSQGGQHGVPGYGTHASQGGTPLKSKDLQEDNNTPLPPAERGNGVGFDSSETGSPVLPAANCTAAHPKFLASLPIASAWVLTQIGSSRRRLASMISEQLRMYCQQHSNEALQQAAAKMAQACEDLHKQAHLLRHKPWGWDKFIGDGHWLRPLPYASQSMSREASIGTYRPDAQAEQRNHERLVERTREFILANAAKAAKLPQLASIVAELREIAANVSADTPLDDLDLTLQQIDDRMFDHALDAYDDEALEQLNAAVEAEFVKRRVRITSKEMQRQLRKQLRRQIVYSTYDLPRLSQFYMGQRST